MCDSILYTICLMPNYMIELSNPFVTKWLLENVLSWFIYLARVMVVSYFALKPVEYFYYFGILSQLSTGFIQLEILKVN